MRIDRLLRAGPFRGGLLGTLHQILSYRTDITQQVTPDLISIANSKWQSVSGGKSMDAECISKEAKTLFTMLVGLGAKPRAASAFVRSLSNDYACLTFPAVKFNKLLHSPAFLIQGVDGEELSNIVAREVANLQESSFTPLVYLEVACRSLIATNIDIMDQFHDEAELEINDSEKPFDMPMKRPILSSSKYLLIVSHDGTFYVHHVPNSRILSLLISREPQTVEGIIVDTMPPSYFRSDDSRLRWVFKLLLLAQLGASRALWIRKGGLLNKLLDKTFMTDPLCFKQESNFNGFYERIISPLRSRIPEADWVRVSYNSRINRIGATVVNGKWEYELVSVSGISHLPPLDQAQEWKVITRTPFHADEEITIRFTTLSLDSESVRKVRIDISDVSSVDYGRRSDDKLVERRLMNQTLAKLPITTTTKAEGIVPDVGKESLSNDEMKSSLSLLSDVTKLETEVRTKISAYFRVHGPKGESEELKDYLTTMYNADDFDSFYRSSIPYWDVQITEDQRRIVRKQTRIIGAAMYMAAFKFKQGGANE